MLELLRYPQRGIGPSPVAATRCGGERPRRYFAVFSSQPEFQFDTVTLADGKLRAIVRTGENRRLRVQTSRYLLPWTGLTSTDAGLVPIEFVDPAPAQQQALFFRAIAEIEP